MTVSFHSAPSLSLLRRLNLLSDPSGREGLAGARVEVPGVAVDRLRMQVSCTGAPTYMRSVDAGAWRGRTQNIVHPQLLLACYQTCQMWQSTRRPSRRHVTEQEARDAAAAQALQDAEAEQEDEAWCDDHYTGEEEDWAQEDAQSWRASLAAQETMSSGR